MVCEGKVASSVLDPWLSACLQGERKGPRREGATKQAARRRLAYAVLRPSCINPRSLVAVAIHRGVE